MTRKELIEALKGYFSIKELVSKCVYKKYGEDKCWCFFNPMMLETLLILRRDILKVPMVVNNWSSGGTLEQRGLRSNKDPLVADKKDIYLSAHVLGSGIDFSSGKMSADKMRDLIVKNQDLLPYPIRLEDGRDAKTWVHFDLCGFGEEKIEWFRG